MENPEKNIPTILPTGFGLRVNSQKMYVVDFFDTDYSDKNHVVGSFAFTEETAHSLAEKIKKIIDQANPSEKGVDE